MTNRREEITALKQAGRDSEGIDDACETEKTRLNGIILLRDAQITALDAKVTRREQTLTRQMQEAARKVRDAPTAREAERNARIASLQDTNNRLLREIVHFRGDRAPITPEIAVGMGKSKKSPIQSQRD